MSGANDPAGEEPMSQDQSDLDPRDNAESQVAEGEASQVGSRSGDSGPVMPDAPEARGASGGEGASERVAEGTGAGDPLAGVKISDEDAADAVPGDTGPEHHGRR